MAAAWALAVTKPAFQIASGAVVPFLLAIALCGSALLLIGLLLAWRAGRPKVVKPPRRSFEAGRRIARLQRVRSTEGALRALRNAPVGEVVRVDAVPHGFDVVLRRKRAQSCRQAAGYLAGLFEGAWARDVEVRHDACAGEKGGECRYLVTRAAPRTAAGATPGSAREAHRSPPARPGAG